MSCLEQIKANNLSPGDTDGLTMRSLIHLHQGKERRKILRQCDTIQNNIRCTSS